MGASKVDVSRCEITQALVIAAMVVVIDECVDPGLEVAGQIIVLKQDAVLERLMPALDLALRLRVARRAAQVIHIAFVQPFGEAGRDIGRAIVRQQSGAMNDLCPIKPRGLQRQVQRFRDVPTFIVVQSFQAMM